MWYGIGNTSMSNPSRMRIGIAADGTVTLYNGAFDIGQGSNTIMTQIAADALGLPAGQMGNSEVGHMNIGAGRVVYQDYTKIEHAIETATSQRNISAPTS